MQGAPAAPGDLRIIATNPDQTTKHVQDDEDPVMLFKRHNNLGSVGCVFTAIHLGQERGDSLLACAWYQARNFWPMTRTMDSSKMAKSK